MEMLSQGFGTRVRASPEGDARWQGPVSVASMQGLPSQGRRRLNKRAPTFRLASLNVGTMTGRCCELAKALEKRHIDICAVQETRWSGQKSHHIGCGYKLIYNGTRRTTNGVGIVVSAKFDGSVSEVQRYDDRLMKIVYIADRQKVHFFSAYAPQTGLSAETKEAFWTLLDEKTAEVPAEDYLIIAGDLNGHVGQRKEDHAAHGGHGYGEKNDDGQRILDYAESHDLIITNTWFKKRESHLITYYSGSNKTQVDYVLVRRRNLKDVLDTKVVPYETVAMQHRPVICRLKMNPPRPGYSSRNGPSRIKWWRFKEKEVDIMTGIIVPPITTVEESWTKLKISAHEAARSILGITKPGRRRINKDAWLWNDKVKKAIHNKKQLYHEFLEDKTLSRWNAYKQARREAKKAVAVTKADKYSDLYAKLDTREGERDIYRLVKSKHRKTEDIQHFYGINDEMGELLVDRNKARERWRSYFETVSTEEFPHPPIPTTSPVEGPVDEINISEVKVALKEMKSGKATGPDDLPAEFWCSQQWNAAGWLTDLFNQIIREGRTPADWQRSITVPIFKRKGSPAECSNYRPIRLLSHAMKIFERILDKRIREIVQITRNQAGFVKNCGTTDAIHAARLLVEKHREKNKPLHLAFLDLEKAFDRVPHDLIWLALREHGVPEYLVNWVQLLYAEPKSYVQAAAGATNDFHITVGVHQGSALSPLLFILVMDTVTSDLHMPLPWTLLYADDVMLAAENKFDLQRQTQVWNDRLAQYGLRLNKKKTEYLTSDPREVGTINVSGENLPRATKFKYLGSTISSDGQLTDEVNARTQAAWMKWRMTTGVTCDRRMKDHLKSKIYRTVIRPVALYGTECWPTTRETERRLGVMETKMLRWTGGITRMDHVSNDTIRKRFGIAPIQKKMRERRLRWFGHVLRADDNSIAKAAYSMEVCGKRPKGRPRQRWADTLHNDLKAVNLHPDMAHDRTKWRQRIQSADPATRRDKR